MIWFQSVSIEQLNERSTKDMTHFLEMEFTEIGEDYLKGKMPVTDKIRQPMGIVHGGAYVSFAETLGSLAANLCIDLSKSYAVGLNIFSNHLKSCSKGTLFGEAKAVHIGKSTQVWEIQIFNDDFKLLNVSRLTMMIKDR